MSKKSKKRKEQRLRMKNGASGRVNTPPPKKKIDKRTAIILTAIAGVLLISVIVGIVIGSLYNKDINYLKADLGKYIELDESDYKGYELDIKFDELTDASVEREIMGLLYKYRVLKEEDKGANVLNVPISVGDTAYIYYRGYTVDESGIERDIKGGSNLLGSIYALGVGSLGFIPGFEEGLVGINPANYPKFEKKTEGTVKTGDVIYLSYSAILPDGSVADGVEERIDLSADYTDSLYGEGFSAYFVGKEIGKNLADSIALPLGDGSVAYYGMKINAATECEKNPLTVRATFPADYSLDRSLRGVEARFDVYIAYTNLYTTPAYDTNFITETLKISEDTLANYDGDTIPEKHRAMLYEALSEEYESAREALIEEAVWERLNSLVRVKRLPRKAVREICDEYYYEVTAAYTSQNLSISLDEFAVYYLEIEEDVSWLDYIKEMARETVTEKLIFYYIIREENLLPKDEEFSALYNDAVEEYLTYYAEQIYDEELAKLSGEAKEKRLLEIKTEMLDYYGEEYFREIVYYEYAWEDIVGWAEIKQ
jgi:FKBP-type peptidyl-prolyl cis-trans isomerase (trigger factor)